MEDLLPFYIYIGVSKAEFMDSEPRELECYDLAYKFSENRKNFHEHMQGAYIAEALKATVCNMFRKNGQAPYEYPTEPFRIFPLTAEEEEEKKEKELQRAIDYFDALAMDSKKYKKNKKRGNYVF